MDYKRYPQLSIFLPGYIPSPKARPRLGRRGVYSPSSKAEMSLARALCLICNVYFPQWQRYSVPVSVDVTITTPKTLRGDLDNYLKFVCDALEKSGLIANDRLIWSTHSQIILGPASLKIIIRELNQKGAK